MGAHSVRRQRRAGAAALKFGIAAKIGLVLAVVGMVAAGTTGFYAYQASRDLLVDSAKNELLTATQVLARRITSARQEVTRNLQIVAAQPETLATLEDRNPANADRVAALFKSIMQANPGYFQIRLISAAKNGMERVRVDRDQGALMRIAGEDLQEKGHYPYVYESLALPAGATYLSRIVLNREVGAHDGLGKPTALLATPVFNSAGKARGLVVISVDLNGIFSLLRADLPAEFQLFFANGKGDFLIHPDPEKTFGFDKGRRFLVQDEFPATQMLIEQKDTHIVTEAGAGRYAGSPVVAAFIAQQVKVVSGEPSVILGLALPRASVVKHADRLGQAMVQIMVGLSLAAIFVALILGRVITRSLNTMSSAVEAFTGSNTLENLPLQRQDEIGVLARSFDRMQNQIRHQLAELEVRGNELQQLAYHDLLTGLPNRRLMMDRLEHTLANTERYNQYGALLLLDLDNFKTLNDSLGHEAGDQLLVEVAARLKASIRQGDTAARLGGDEFVLILEQLDERGIAATQAEIVATKLLRSLAQPYMIEIRERSGEVSRHSHRCTSSIGIAMFSDRSVSPEELLKRADSAMYQSKAAGRNTLCFFGRDRQMPAAG